MNYPLLRSLVSWIVSLLVVVALVLTAVRLLLTPVFLHVEYNLPGFPQDTYGFTTQQRLYWSQIALDYLLNSADISFLSNLRFEDGSPVYNERELSHMVDVKVTVRATLLVWYISLGALAVIGIWLWRTGWLVVFTEGLARGGWLTVLLLAAILLFVLIGFRTFFVAFHEVFFRPGTWMFLFSDTLIRLFPERFWRDIFITVGTLALGGGLALAYFFRSPRIH